MSGRILIVETMASQRILLRGVLEAAHFAVQAAPTTVLCRVDLGAWTACTTGGSHTAADVALGSHVLHVRAIDQWSNAHEVEHAFTAIAPAPVIVSSSVDGVGADGATVRALVRAGGVERLAHVEYAAGAVGPGTETVSSAARTVGASGEQQLAFRLAGLAGNVEYSWRVVVDGNGSSVATAWSTLRTPRSGEVLDVRVPALANPGERVAITVGRLAADEAYTVRLAGADVATGRANARGSARVVVPIARTARSGERDAAVHDGHGLAGGEPGHDDRLQPADRHGRTPGRHREPRCSQHLDLGLSLIHI